MVNLDFEGRCHLIKESGKAHVKTQGGDTGAPVFFYYVFKGLGVPMDLASQRELKGYLGWLFFFRPREDRFRQVQANFSIPHIAIFNPVRAVCKLLTI